MTEPCLFCRIVRGEIPASLVAESEHAIAIRDVAPQAPVHVLVIPREHVASLAVTTNTSVLADLLLLAASVARAEGVEGDGYRVVVNTGENGGQSVAHLHVHVLGGRPLRWPPG